MSYCINLITASFSSYFLYSTLKTPFKSLCLSRIMPANSCLTDVILSFSGFLIAIMQNSLSVLIKIFGFPCLKKQVSKKTSSQPLYLSVCWGIRCSISQRKLNCFMSGTFYAIIVSTGQTTTGFMCWGMLEVMQAMQLLFLSSSFDPDVSKCLFSALWQEQVKPLCPM